MDTDILTTADSAVTDALDDRPRHEQFAGDLDVANDVRARTHGPNRVAVKLWDADTIPEHVAEIVDQYGASIDPASVTATNGDLKFIATVPEQFQPAGANQVRTHGSSVVVTFPEKSLELSEIDVDDDVTVRARKDAILLVSDEQRASIALRYLFIHTTCRRE